MKNKMLKRSHLSEKTCREIIQLFSDDLTATQIAGITNVSRVTINNYLKLIRSHIAKHCEEQSHNIGNNKMAATAFHKMPAPKDVAEDSNAYFGFYVIDDNVFTDELLQISKPVIREYQQVGWMQRNENVINTANDLSRYNAIADFDEWRLYRIDAHDSYGKSYADDISVFWGNTRNRLLKFRGMNKNTLYLHVKESEFRYNYRNDDINKILLNIIYKYPLHLSKSYV
ncbi:MAG: HTH domain-containing protein [Chitinophagaceae bacterium]